MKKVFFLVVLLFASLSLYAQDTLRYWTSSDQISYFNTEQIKPDWQFQRFEISKPILINSFIIYLFGSGSEVEVKLLGNEGGSALPALFVYTGQDVLATANYTFPGSETPVGVVFNLQNPVYFYGHQLFIAVNIKNSLKCYIATNQTQYNPTCQPGQGLADYYYQYFVNTDSTEYLWTYAKYSFFADLVYTSIPDNPGGKYFRDYTGTLGISFNLPGNSIACADFNKDGYQDFLISGRLYASSDGTGLQDMTNKLGLEGNPSANSFVDIDNDGDLDILFLFSSKDASTSNVLYINDGSGNLTKKELAMTKFTNVSGFSFTDANYDGFPDFFVAQSVTATDPPTVLSNYFFKNNGNYMFMNQSLVCKTNPARASTACQFVDYNNDGLQDLYVTNGYFQSDELWENQGLFNFVDVADSKKIDRNQVGNQKVSDYGTGCDWYDYDNDGNQDLYLPNLCYANWLPQGHHASTIYNNVKATLYDTYNLSTGLTGLGIDFEETYCGGAWGDMDNDGLADLFIPASTTCRYSKMFHQLPNNNFENISYDCGLDKITCENDALWVDFDNDGMLDLVLSQDNNFKIYKNYIKNSNNWIELDLVGKECNKFAIGSKVKVYTTDGKMLTQEVMVGHGRCMQKPYRLHFGLGTSSSIDRVEILWNHSSSWEIFKNIEINKITQITQIGTSVENNEILNEFIEIYPNPVVLGKFTIEIALNKSGFAQVQLFDLQGNLIKDFANKYYETGANYIECKIDNIANGAYFIALTTDKNRLVKPIIISR
ncbi:MAG TPA: FG-GAP-like repeat-containing protein [Candidatus Kapabacteria bacterium]|nr:VCBS repeat-containing protein [Candidatus Kapabacteria bacterium]HOV91713.1 FG-GAP-like repeat-containing protein [Candidatus Kapabacteria bacterium]